MSASEAARTGGREDDTHTVRVYSRHRFSERDFTQSLDQFKDVIILSQETFRSLFDDDRPTGYVTVSTRDGDERLTVYALTFSDAHEPDGEPDAYLRDNVKQRLSTDSEDPLVRVSPVSMPDSGPLEVVRLSTRSESTEPDVCRIHPETLASLGLADGERIELYNPDTGYRFQPTATAEPSLDRDQISVSTRARKMLKAEFHERAGDGETESLRARRPVACHDPDRPRFRRLRRASRSVLDRVVNYHETQLRVVIGLNADEGRGTGRVNADTMDVLAVEDGDRVRLSAKETETSVRVRQIAPDSHLIETDEDIDAADVRDRTILLPSTVREEIDAVCGDTVSIRRDTRHIAIRQITPSMFAFLGVFIGGVQTVNLVVPASLRLYGLALTLFFAVVAIWLLLWPERERCR